MPGYEIAVLDDNNQPLPAGEIGAIVIKLPLPPGCLPTLWNNRDGFENAYLADYRAITKPVMPDILTKMAISMSCRAQMTLSMWPDTACPQAAWKKCWAGMLILPNVLFWACATLKAKCLWVCWCLMMG